MASVLDTCQLMLTSVGQCERAVLYGQLGLVAARDIYTLAPTPSSRMPLFLCASLQLGLVAALWGLLLPVIYALATTATNAVFKDAIVLKGPCPSCNAENFTYFGDILTVPGNRGTNAVSGKHAKRVISCLSGLCAVRAIPAFYRPADCCNCGAGLSFDEGKRIIVVTESAEDKKKKAEAAAAKKAASAAKKKAKMAAK
eukprot:210265-Pelagomonas_calceolata.AAC.1